MAFTLCTSAAAKLAAGANVNTTLTGSNDLNTFSTEAEDYICAVARSDVITAFATLTTSGKNTLGRLAANLIASKIINYDITNFNSFSEAQLRMNFLENAIRKDEAIVKDDKNKTYLGIVS